MRSLTLLIASHFLISVQVFARPGNLGMIVKTEENVRNIADVAENPGHVQKAIWEKSDCDLKTEVKALNFGHTQRHLNDRENRAFAGVGSFMCKAADGSWKHFGTGFLTSVSQQHILTNVHPFTPEPNAPDVCDGSRREIKFYSETCRDFYDVSSSTFMNEDTITYREQDVAVVKLSKPLCNNAAGLKMKILSNTDVTALNAGGAAIVSTYPTPGFVTSEKLASATKPTFESSIPNNAQVQKMSKAIGFGKVGSIVKRPNGYMIEYTVNTGNGASGGPASADWNGDFMAFGIHSGAENQNSKYNWGVAFTRENVAWITQQMSN